MGVFGNGYIHESSTLHKAFLGFKIKPHQNLWESAKKHSYPGFLEFVKKCNDVDDLKYLLKDTSTAYPALNKMADKLDDAKKNPAPDDRGYRAVKKEFIDRGITGDDIRKYCDWLKNVWTPACKDRIKELKK